MTLLVYLGAAVAGTITLTIGVKASAEIAIFLMVWLKEKFILN